MAQSYADAVRAGCDMRATAQALETVRAALVGPVDLFRTWAVLDDQIGRAGVPPLQDVLVAVRANFLGQLNECLVGELEPAFASDPAAAWVRWLELYATALGEWRVRFCDDLARLPLAFPAHDPPIEMIRKWTGLALQERWPEVYQWICWLAESGVSAETRARMHELAGKIQLHRFLRMGKAREHFEKAESLNHDDPDLKGAWGQYWLDQGDKTQAKDYYQKQIRAAPDREDGYTNVGNLLADEGDLTGAEGYMQQAIEHCPGSPFGYGALLELFGKPELYPYRTDQLADLDRRIRVLAPWYPVSDDLRQAEILDGNGKREEARAIANKLREKYPEHLRPIMSVGLSYLREWASIPLGDPREKAPFAAADQTLREAIVLAPSAYDGYWELSTLFKENKDYDEALKHCEKGIELDPNWEPKARLRMGELLHKLGKLDLARHEYARVHELEPDFNGLASGAQSLGDDFLYKSKDLDGAIELYALGRHESVPTSEASYQNRVGNAYYYMDRDADAAVAYQRAIDNDPSEPVYHANLAGAFEHMKTPNERASELEQAIAALDHAIAAHEKAKARSTSDSDDTTHAGYVARRERLQKLLSFIERYGEAALDLIPTMPIIRFQLDDKLMPRLLIEDQTALTPDIQRLTDAVRLQVKETTGILVAGIRYGWLGEADAREGAWLMTIEEGRATATGVVIPWGEAFLPDLRDKLRQALEERAWACVSHDTIDAALEDAMSKYGDHCEHCDTVRENPALLNRLVTVARQHMRGGSTLRDLRPLLKELVATNSTPTSATQTDSSKVTGTAPAPFPRFRVAEDDRWWLDLDLGSVQQSLFQETGVVIPKHEIESDPSLAGDDPPVLMIGDQPMPTPTEDPTPTPYARLRSEIWRFISDDLVRHYLTLIEETRPVLIQTARALLGPEKIRAAMVERVKKGESVRHMATLLDELLGAEAAAAASAKVPVASAYPPS